MPYPEYRPRSAKILAVLEALPGTVAEQVHAGRGTQRWVQDLLTKMVHIGVCRRSGVRYYMMYPIRPALSLTDDVEQLLREHGQQTVSELQARGIPRGRVHSTLRSLELRGAVEVNSTVRPFRYSVPERRDLQGLEALAAYASR